MFMLDKIVSKVNTARSKGIKWCIFCKGYSLLLKILEKIYGFHPWHSDNPISCRPYKEYVAGLVNSLNPNSVVEIGCGLGDIVCTTTAEIKYGVDPDHGAIQAAKLLHPFSDVTWLDGDLRKLNDIPGHIDVLVAVGWVHDVSPDYLKACIEPNCSRISYIIFDRFIQWDDPPYIHDFAFLNDFSSCIAKYTPAEDSIREYLVFKVNAS